MGSWNKPLAATYNTVADFAAPMSYALLVLFCVLHFDKEKQMFKSIDYGIPQDKLDCLNEMLKDNGIAVSVENVPCNPNLNIEDGQQFENILVDRINSADGDQPSKMSPRHITSDMYRHQVLIFTLRKKTEKIFFSTPKHKYDKNGKLVRNLETKRDDAMPEDFRGIYYFSVYLRYVMRCWLPLIEDDIYKWAELYDTANLLADNNSYLYRSFDYYREIATMFIELFGQDTIENAIDDLSVCGCCGKTYKQGDENETL